ncbi:hypothetical protein QCA50_007688 [Cerrena zonata]|uniref:Uncharacterized protein n=1 Tax=Cerrena zonata TaxID=2478898 RepID=A0AAW0GBR8_9APHY
MKSAPLSSSNNSPRPARTGERLIKRLCADERTLRKALALHTRLEKVFKQDALPNVCAYLACEILGTEDVSWEAASLACGPGEPACFELWRSVRVVLSRFEPTVSFISLSRLYNIDAPESFINVLGAVKARAIEDSAFTSPESRDSIFFSVFIWTCSILNVDNVTVPLIADDYDLEEDELSNYVRAVASRCITLSPMIIRHIEATKPANGRLVTIIQVHGELPPQLTSPVKPKSPKRERENEDILLQDAPQLKRLKPAPTSRLDGIRRTANKLSNTAAGFFVNVNTSPTSCIVANQNQNRDSV